MARSDANHADERFLFFDAVRFAVIFAGHVVNAGVRKVVVLILVARVPARPATGRVALAPSAASIMGRLLNRGAVRVASGPAWVITIFTAIFIPFVHCWGPLPLP